MEFSIKKLAPETAKAGCIVVGVHQAGELTQAARAVDQASKGAVRAALRDLSGKTGSTLLLRGLPGIAEARSEEHTSELQSRLHLVCRLLLEKKKYIPNSMPGQMHTVKKTHRDKQQYTSPMSSTP